MSGLKYIKYDMFQRQVVSEEVINGGSDYNGNKSITNPYQKNKIFYVWSK